VRVVYTNNPGPGLVAYQPAEAFEVDGIRYVAPHVAYQMLCEEDPSAPDPETGQVIRRPMIGFYLDHMCPQPDEWCDPAASGRAWRWEPYPSVPERSSP